MREALVDGLIHETGLIAHGRGEAFDYIFGEKSPPTAHRAARAAAHALRWAQRPVVSVNGNVAALAAREAVKVARAAGARLEVNLFHRSEARVRRIVRELERHGGRDVLGASPDARIPGLASDRARCHRDGIFSADVVLVPLEDGDRAEALQQMGKWVLAIDLNPLSRTARAGTITIVDEVRRALRGVHQALRARPKKPTTPPRFDNRQNLVMTLKHIERQLRREARTIRNGRRTQ